MFAFEYTIVILSSICFRNAVSLECYNCSNITNVNNCATTISCSSDQSCFLEYNSAAGYTLGCIENDKCGPISHTSASIVGRNLNAEKPNYLSGSDLSHLPTDRDLAKREAQHCFECCGLDICNRHLCGHLKPTACIDDPKVDCAWFNSKFHICENIHEAKTVCPKFCKLCSLVDGNWADWSSWSACDVTCENGTQARTRQCSNPAPVNGGLNCSGSDTEHKICTLQTCPVDGNWAAWSTWSSCDVSCENGTQTRTRACSNPAPGYGGRNCSGTSAEYKQCINDNCPIHGGWTQWLPWEACSVTCDIGIQSRHRNCSNPIPQHSGHYCFGDTMGVTMCLPGPCANGGWSTWDSWSTCSVTCGAGIKSRSRTCTNPRPSVLGRQCEGDPVQDVSCNTNMCLIPNIAFQAHYLTSLGLNSEGAFIFTNATLNAGNAYNSATGIFTAPVAGTYFFSAQICLGSSSSDYTRFQIVRNNVPMTSTLIIGNNVNVECYGAAVTSVLSVNDRVWVKHLALQGGSLYQDVDALNMFSGSLQHL